MDGRGGGAGRGPCAGMLIFERKLHFGRAGDPAAEVAYKRKRARGWGWPYRAVVLRDVVEVLASVVDLGGIDVEDSLWSFAQVIEKRRQEPF